MLRRLNGCKATSMSYLLSSTVIAYDGVLANSRLHIALRNSPSRISIAAPRMPQKSGALSHRTRDGQYQNLMLAMQTRNIVETTVLLRKEAMCLFAVTCLIRQHPVSHGIKTCCKPAKFDNNNTFDQCIAESTCSRRADISGWSYFQRPTC